VSRTKLNLFQLSLGSDRTGFNIIFSKSHDKYACVETFLFRSDPIQDKNILSGNPPLLLRNLVMVSEVEKHVSGLGLRFPCTEY